MAIEGRHRCGRTTNVVKFNKTHRGSRFVAIVAIVVIVVAIVALLKRHPFESERRQEQRPQLVLVRIRGKVADVERVARRILTEQHAIVVHLEEMLGTGAGPSARRTRNVHMMDGGDAGGGRAVGRQRTGCILRG